MNVLLLGGTTEGRALAERLAGEADMQVLTSLAGRTQAPMDIAGAVRIGGFGGADGLTEFLRHGRFDVVVDATHPFARRMSDTARIAAAAAGIALLRLERPAWQRGDGDNWVDAATPEAAAEALGTVPKRVFLTIGRLGVAAFRANPIHHYLLRSIDPPAASDLPPDVEVILARGPFAVDDEAALMRSRRIDILVTKNSGGPLTHAKLAAARLLGLPVIVITRPQEPIGPVRTDVDQIMRDLRRLAARGG